MRRWLSIDWKGFGRTQPWPTYAADRCWAVAADLAAAFGWTLESAFAVIWSVVDPDVRHKWPAPPDPPEST